MAAEDVVVAAVVRGDAANGVSIVTVAFKLKLMVPKNKAKEAVKFYKEVFSAEEVKRVNHPNGKAEQDAPVLLCNELKIGGSGLLVCSLPDESEACSAKTVSNVDASIIFRLEVEDVTAAIAHAVKGGVIQEGEVSEEEGLCDGGLVGKVKDPFGHVWAISVTNKCCAVVLDVA